jgi:serine/threonine protein kinase
MEKLDISVKSLLQKQEFEIEKQFLIALMYVLYFLQQTTNFVHRDLHTGNVMLKKLNNLQKTEIFINNKKVTEIFTKYQIYLIDFGFSCLSFQKCNIDLPDVVSGDFYDSHKCTNKSHDARLFCASLLFANDAVLSQKLTNYLEKLLSRYTKLNKFSNFSSKNHFFYNEVIEIDDPNFYPENIILNLIKL